MYYSGTSLLPSPHGCILYSVYSNKWVRGGVSLGFFSWILGTIRIFCLFPGPRNYKDLLLEYTMHPCSSLLLPPLTFSLMTTRWPSSNRRPGLIMVRPSRASSTTVVGLLINFFPDIVSDVMWCDVCHSSVGRCCCVLWSCYTTPTYLARTGLGRYIHWLLLLYYKLYI